jgi:acetoin utilization protein AcuB
MRIRDLMSTNVVAVDEATSVHDARKIMEAHKIRRLPVMRRDRLVGLVTERMLLESEASSASGSAANASDTPLSRKPVKEVMVRDPYTLSPDMPPEEALEIGQEMGYGGFPVVEDDVIVGMVTESDIVRLMTRVLGVRGSGRRIDLKVSREFGTMQRIMEVLDEKRAVLLSLMTFLRPQNGEYLIILRIRSEDADPVADGLKSSGFNVTYVG